MQSFFDAMSKVAASVHIVTTAGPAGIDGITVSSMTSVSAEPPTVLICINKDSTACDKIMRNGKFCINLLKNHQSELSDQFASKSTNLSVDNSNWPSSKNGCPRFLDALVCFDCSISGFNEVGTHIVFFGEITHIDQSEGSPLIYVNRDYADFGG